MSAPTPSSVLETIVARRRADLASGVALPSMAGRPLAPAAEPGRLERALRTPSQTPRLILEIKPASPSAGVLADAADWPERVAIYGPHAIGLSALTEPHWFGGSFERMGQIAAQTSLPVLCKDFIVDPRQLDAARAYGAEAALLIVKSLDDDALGALTDHCVSLGMTPVIEIQNEAEARRAQTLACLQQGVGAILINNRNLDTLAIDLATTPRLSALLPPGALRISASGLETRAQMEALRPYCDGFLMGSALMRQPAGAALRETLAALASPVAPCPPPMEPNTPS